MLQFYRGFSVWCGRDRGRTRWCSPTKRMRLCEIWLFVYVWMLPCVCLHLCEHCKLWCLLLNVSSWQINAPPAFQTIGLTKIQLTSFEHQTSECSETGKYTVVVEINYISKRPIFNKYWNLVAGREGLTLSTLAVYWATSINISSIYLCGWS